MDTANKSDQDNRASAVPVPPFTSYEMAVLSTLFEEGDLEKLALLAQQWGYHQEALSQIWRELHSDRLNLPVPPPDSAPCP